MSTPAAPSPQAATATTDTKLARLFGLQGESWMRHANPISVWTRFAVLPLLAVVAGLVIVQCAKAWFIDRMVLLFEDMKTHNPAYAGWEY